MAIPNLILAGLIFLAATANAQSPLTEISGTIKDNRGLPIEGATVSIRGSTEAVAADPTGIFRIRTSKGFPLMLVISSVGYQPSEFELLKNPGITLQIVLFDHQEITEVVVSSRRRLESAQSVPISISVISAGKAGDAGAFNVNRLKELVPAVQLYSSNPRNTTLNIRGLGSTFGLTNDGIDPGVGFYIDGVYYARAAATALDFIDIDQIEVLRGPQGTLFGKNTTAGAFNITTKAPSFKGGASAELSFGNYGFVQAKAVVTGGLTKHIAGRLSLSGTQRNGLLTNINTGESVNDMNTLGIRGQLLFQPSDKFKLLFAGDVTDQKPIGYAQVIAGVAPTKRAGYRQFDSIIADLGYRIPSTNPFDRLIDHNTPWKSGNELGGVHATATWNLRGNSSLTSTTAWRYWNWSPSNDRDFTALNVLQRSQANSRHRNWSQELRYAGNVSPWLHTVAGLFLIGQKLFTDPYHIEESGHDQWRFAQSSRSTLWKTPGLLDGYGIRTVSTLNSFGAAAFAQFDARVGRYFHFLPGLRFNHDAKEVFYERKVYGGLIATDAALVALQRQVYSDQNFNISVSEQNWSGQATLQYKPSKSFQAFTTYSLSYKPVGVNLGGLPTSNGKVMLELAEIKPERVNHWEAGIKSTLHHKAILNFTAHYTRIKDYQTQVQSPETGVNRGYLANAEKVVVWGGEADLSIRHKKWLALNANLAYTKGVYKHFTNAPVPLEETGGSVAFKNISGELLPGISKWTGAAGFELLGKDRKVLEETGNLFFAADSYFRSGFSSSPSPSAYLNVEGYTLLNVRLGVKSVRGFSGFFWIRNIANKNYFEQLLPAAGNAGHFAGVLGDPRTYGITLRYTL